MDERHELQRRLHRHWVEQLYREYRNICFQYRLSLSPVVISIEPLSSKWGEWSSLGVIRISSQLIERHSWDVVLEILKHEMAHQLVHELYGGDNAPHGNNFARAAERLALSDWAARATGDLPDGVESWKDRAMSPEEERLLRRAEKLLSLATSSNEHEALLAMQRVQELYTRHNIESLRARRGAAMVYLILDLKCRRVDTATSLICGILAKHFFVEVIFNSQYNAKADVSSKVAELLGSRENVQMAEYVFHFLKTQTDLLWRTYKKQNGKKGSSKRSYIIGVLTGFTEKLARQKFPQDLGLTLQETKAIMAMGADQLQTQFVRKRYPRITRRTYGTTFGDVDSYQDGKIDGRNLTLHRPVHEHHGKGGFLPQSTAKP